MIELYSFYSLTKLTNQLQRISQNQNSNQETTDINQMLHNVIDVTNLLALISNSNAPEDYNVPVRQLSKSKTHFGSFGSAQFTKSSGAMLKPNRQSSIKNSKRKAQIYEIMDNIKIIIYRGPSSSSYTFDHIQQNYKKFEDVISWLFNKNKVIEQIEMNVLCKLVVAHNYSPSNTQNLMQSVGKRLLSEGFSFQIYCFWGIRSQINYFDGLQRRKRSQIVNRDQYPNNDSGFGKSIKFMTELKQYINDIRCIRQPVSKFWIVGPYLSLGVGVCSTYKQQFAIEIVEQLISDFGHYSKQKIENVNFKVALCTLSEAPNQNNIESCKSLFEDAILLKDSVRKYAISRKKSSQFNISKQSKQLYKDKIKKYKINQQYEKNERLSKSQSQKFPIKQQFRRQKKQKKADKNQLSVSSEDQSLVLNKNQLLAKQKYNALTRQSENNMASLMAENMNLKWQLQTVQKQYEQQSQKFVKKNKQKLEALRQERSFILQENAKLRKDNEDLLLEINTIKLDYELVIKSRAQYESIIHSKNQEKQLTIAQNAQFKIKELEQKLISIKAQKQALQNELLNSKSALEDGRRRNKQRIQQVTEEINSYKKFCEELKVAYDQLEKQANLDKDRCLNLQKRCKKYQQTLSELLKMKDSNRATDSLELEQDFSIVLNENNREQKHSDKGESLKRDKNTKIKKQELEQKLFGEQAKRARKWSKNSQKTLNYYEKCKENKKLPEVKGKQQISRQKRGVGQHQMLISFGK